MTNSGRYVHLDEHVGRVYYDELPEGDNAFLVCLTEAEVHIIRRHVFPYAAWETRFVKWVQNNLFQTASVEAFSAYKEAIETLDNKLGGELMSCEDIGTGLQAIAAALAGLQPGSMNVSCGDGACGAIGGAMATMPTEDILPQAPVTEPSPQEDPPEGFETWEAYFTHKCRAAWFLWQGLHNLALVLSGLSGVAAIGTAVFPALIGWTVGMSVVFPPAGLALLLAETLGFLVITLGAFYSLVEAITYLDDNKQAIICAMYASGSADAAINELADFWENAIEQVSWEGLLAPLAGPLKAALASIFSQAINVNTANVLFTVAEDVLLPDVECECVPATEWHFDAGAEGWVFEGTPPPPILEEHGWTAAESGKDPVNGSAGRLYETVNMVTFPPGFYPAWERWLPAGYVVHTGDTFTVDIYASGPSPVIHTFIEYTDEAYDTTGEIYNWDGWGSQQLAVTSGNNGKSIQRLIVAFEERSTGICYFAVDKAILALA